LRLKASDDAFKATSHILTKYTKDENFSESRLSHSFSSIARF
jgi:hypothetical protein